MTNIRDLIKTFKDTYPVPERKQKREKESEKGKREK